MRGQYSPANAAQALMGFAALLDVKGRGAQAGGTDAQVELQRCGLYCRFARSSRSKDGIGVAASSARYAGPRTCNPDGPPLGWICVGELARRTRVGAFVLQWAAAE